MSDWLAAAGWLADRRHSGKHLAIRRCTIYHPTKQSFRSFSNGNFSCMMSGWTKWQILKEILIGLRAKRIFLYEKESSYQAHALKFWLSMLNFSSLCTGDQFYWWHSTCAFCWTHKSLFLWHPLQLLQQWWACRNPIGPSSVINSHCLASRCSCFN